MVHPSFEDFVRDQIRSVEKGSSQSNPEALEIFRLLQSIAKGFGEFLNGDILNDICLLTVKQLPGKVGCLFIQFSRSDQHYLTNLFLEYLKCSDPEMKQTLLDLADTIISCRKAPTPLNQIHQILQHYSRSEFTDLETLKIVTRLNDLCSRLVAPFHPAKIVEFIKIEDGLLESSIIESNSIDRN